MTFRFASLLMFLLYATPSISQIHDSFGNLSHEEQNFSSFVSDPSAGAVVLYEKGNNYFQVIRDYIYLVKEYHGKIKILDETGFDSGTISIPYYKGEKSSEKVKNLKALTHNGKAKTAVRADQIFDNNFNNKWFEKKFTFPNIKKGSVLEYEYKIISPYIYHLNGWEFQSDIPKVYSEFNAKIPGNYIYNRNMSGALKLDINDAQVKKECFTIEGYTKAADCEILKYAMRNIPAFKEEEYMLASSNYISRIDFELSEHRRLDGVTDKYTKSWKDVDREFKSDKDIGRQLTKKGFFEKNVPDTLLTHGNELERARNIYKFVQNHYTWNEKYGIYRDIRVKEAFEAKKGNVGEINISLINLLNAAEIPTQLMLLSTRNNGLPKKTHPVMSDFNYVIAKTTIMGKDYFLDATDKFVPFGMLPYRSLNYYGRVMDFKNDSYWQDINIKENNKYLVRSQLTLDAGQNKIYGILDEVNLGYEAIFRKKSIDKDSEDDYLDKMEDRASGNMEITSYKTIEGRNNEKMTSERFEFEIQNVLSNDMGYLNPFIIKFFAQDPFLSKERHFPIDFGFNRNYEYSVNLVLPEDYEVEELPKNKAVALPQNLGIMKFTAGTTGSGISIHYSLILNNSYYPSELYPSLKDLFKYAIDLQKNTVLVIKRKQS